MNNQGKENSVNVNNTGEVDDPVETESTETGNKRKCRVNHQERRDSFIVHIVVSKT